MPPLEIILVFLLASIVIVVAWAQLHPRKRKQARPPRPDDPVPANAIVVDASNVMHWGGQPSAKTLIKVINALERAKLTPIAIFDASAGYKLSDRYMNERALSDAIGLPRQHIYVVHKGVVADEVILDFAKQHGLRIVTNDRYRDWAGPYPMVKDKRRLIKGTFKGGHVKLPSL